MSADKATRFPYDHIGYANAVAWLNETGRGQFVWASANGQLTNGWSIIDTANTLWNKQKEDDYDAALAQALTLLRALADLQNGPPLERYRKEWESVMYDVYDFLRKHEPHAEI